MPPVSQAQRRWAWANRDEDPAAAEYAAADKGGKLPARVKDGKSSHYSEAHHLASKIIKRLQKRDRKK